MTPGRNTVYGAALNHRSLLDSLGDALHARPYLKPPQGPVLYIKPANTWIGDGEPIPLAADVAAIQPAVSLAAVIGRDMTRVEARSALDHVAGFTVVNDVTVPHTDYFRPVIQNRCRDGFCPIGSTLTAVESMPALDQLKMRIWIDGCLAYTGSTAALVRPVARLLADVSSLFTLAAGDLLLVGAAPNAPLARVGNRVAVEVDGVGRIENALTAERVET